MMEVTITCPECGSGVHIHPTMAASQAQCSICQKELDVHFTENHSKGVLRECPCCERKDFYSQKDFNRKLGVILFIITALMSLWMFMSPYAPYSFMPFIILYLFDFVLFKKLKPIAICYKCDTIFRNVENIKNIPGFDHEMNDRIKYADHDFGGRGISEEDSIIH